MSYTDYLKTDHWYDTRRRTWAENRPICGICRKGNVPLDVHHKTYQRIGKEKSEDLMLVCRECHTGIHALLKDKKNPQVADVRKATNRYRRTLYKTREPRWLSH